MTKPELLAPAANFEFMQYAFAYGADAVYAGQPQFSLRQRQNGFADIAEVEKAIQYARKLGKKFYLTSNVIPRNNKIAPFLASLEDYLQLRPDAFIVSDPGIIGYLASKHPDIELHLSVQANCTNWLAAKFWYEQGIKRIILSRELLLREIAEIHAKVPQVELEAFVHGAVCMAHSGRCLLSNYMNYRDSNQGHCNNACRFPYQLYAKNNPQDDEYVPLQGEFYLTNLEGAKNGMEPEFIPVDEDQYGTYIMNSRDICAIESLEELADAGVVSFKLEGRTKSLNYLCQTVRTYRQGIDNLMVETPLDPELRKRLEALDSRGYMDPLKGGKHALQEGKDVPQNLAHSHEKGQGMKVAAFIREYDASSGRVIVSVRGTIEKGKNLLLISPDGEQHIQVRGLSNHKGIAVSTLHSGMENCTAEIDFDPGQFSFLTTSS